MTKTVAEKLTDLVKAVQELPDEAQEALVEELSERVLDATTTPTLSDEQVVEV